MWSLAAAALTNIFNGVAAHRANKVNQRNYEEVRRYNTPAQQMGRFRAAGLNPNLIYTQTNEAEQRPEWKPPSYDFSAVANVPSELSQYQNVKESKSRVDNLVKQNKLLDEQITSQIIANNFAEELTRKNIDLIDRQIKQIDKAIDNIDFEQEFKNRQLNNDTIKALWSFALQYATIGLQGQELKLKQDQFQEQVRQFNLQNRGRVFVDEFLKELTGSQSAKDAASVIAKLFAKMILNGFSS